LTIIFFLLAAGLLLFVIRPRKVSINFAEITLLSKRLAITKQKLGRLEKLKLVIGRTLLGANVSWRVFIICCAGAFAAGFAAGGVLFGSAALALTLALSSTALPFLIFYLSAARAKRAEFGKLESAMSIITNAYASSYNILAAVEHYTTEQHKGIPAALRVNTPFDTFISNATVVGYSVEKSLMILDAQIGNPYFTNWVKMLRMCASDRNMLFALYPVIQSMSDFKNMQAEADVRAETAWRNYLMVVAIAVGLTPMFRILNIEWYNLLTKTFFGNVILILLLASCIVSAFFVVRISRKQ
jgi:hypothetical protein